MGVVAGAPSKTFVNVRSLVAEFNFASLPRQHEPITVTWSRTGDPATVTTHKPFSRRVVAIHTDTSPLAPGRWTCTLRVGTMVVDRVSAGVRR